MAVHYTPEEYEHVFDIMLSVMRLIYIAGCIYCLSLFYQKMMGTCIKRRQYKYIVCIVYAFVFILGYYLPFEFPAIAVYGAAAAAAFAASVVVYNAQWTLKLYVAVTFLAIQYMIFAVSVNTVPLLLKLRMSLFGDVPAYSDSELNSYIFIECINRTAVIVLTYLAVKIISKQFNASYTVLTPVEAASLILPSAALLLNLWLLSYMNNYTENSAIGAAEISAGIISLICVIFIAVLFKKINFARNTEKSNVLLAQQAADLKKQFDEQKEVQKEKSAMLHDYRNQLQTIKTLSKNGKTADLDLYIDEIAGNIQAAYKSITVITGNPIADSIIMSKTEAAQKKGKKLDIKMEKLPDKIKSYDIGVILTNALDNAIEAECTDENSVIRVCGADRGGSYILVIENPFIGTLKRAGSEIISSKGEGRGFGLANIKAAARNYAGIVEVEADNNKFSLSIMLKYC